MNTHGNLTIGIAPGGGRSFLPAFSKRVPGCDQRTLKYFA